MMMIITSFFRRSSFESDINYEFIAKHFYDCSINVWKNVIGQNHANIFVQILIRANEFWTKNENL